MRMGGGMSAVAETSAAKGPESVPNSVPAVNRGPFENQAHVSVDPMKEKSNYSLLISGVTPRPTAFVSTVSSSGAGNLAPFSYFGLVSHDPPTVVIGIGMKPGGVKKDTLLNIEETGEFVVNMISEWMCESATFCAGDFQRGEDEMKITGLTPQPSEVIKTPRVKESAFQMECVLTNKNEIINDAGKCT